MQESLGFSPNELVFGHNVREPLTVMRHQWLTEDKPSNLLTYVTDFKQRIFEAYIMCANLNLKLSQKKIKTWYDKIEPGDRVLLLLPVPGSLTPKFKGLYSVLSREGDLDYIVATPDRRKAEQRVHINMMKPFYERKLLSNVSPVLLSASSKVNSSHMEEKNRLFT